ncbi:MAG TPA: hypothetical protein VHM30_01420, partial [Gemmatimonadaceae bacterium]|nr:hypothetical protein [Gemmatimonadaceae bacterium]
LKRKDEHLVRLELAGYHPYDVPLKRGVNGWVWGNIVFGGLPGLAVDAITGALYKLKPGDVNGTLTRQTASRGGDAIQVVVVMQPDASWEKIGQLTPAGR